MFRFFISSVCCIILSASLFGFTTHTHSELEVNSNDTEEYIRTENERISLITGAPLSIYKPNFTAQTDTPQRMTEQYLRAKADQLKIKSDLSDLTHLSTRVTRGGTHVRFYQHVDGVPVYNAQIIVNIDRHNRVYFVGSSYKPDLDVPHLTTAVSETQAVLIAKDHLNTQGQINYENTESVIYANRGEAVLVQQVKIAPAESPSGDWEVLVHAQTGEIVKAVDNACYSRGRVFDPDPVARTTGVYGEGGLVDNNDADSEILTAQLVEVNLGELTFENGEYFLIGEYAEIIDDEGPYTGLYGQPGEDFLYTRSQGAFEATNIYHHVTHSMRYINEELGFTVMPIQYTGGVRFDPHGLNGGVNAHYMSSTGIIAFGSPSNDVDLGEEQTIVLHELGHGIHDWITGGNLSQVEGLSEGCSDYWAQSYNRSLGFWEPEDEGYDWFGVWGGMPSLDPPNMRVTNYTAHYPEGLIGQVHTDGQMWSSTLMSIYDEIGREANDSDFLECMSTLNNNSGQEDAAQAFVYADVNLYNGAHIVPIEHWFTDRGYDVIIPELCNFAGRITDGEMPLNQARVTFTEIAGQSYEMITAENGQYEIWTYPGIYTMHVERFGYFDHQSQESYTIENGDEIIVDVTMDIQPTGTLQGTVTDDRTGEPLEDAVVHLVGVPIVDAITDENGFYSFGEIHGDYTYSVHAQALSYGQQTIDVLVTSGEENTQDFALQFAQSFEADDGDWRGTGEWEWGTPVPSGGPDGAYEGSNCWGTDLDDDYNTSANYILITDSYTLTDDNQLHQLNFYHWYETDDGWDGGQVQISIDNGDTWTRLDPVGDYPDLSVVGLAGQPGYTGNSDGWIPATFDLSDYAGLTVQFRFRFRSTNSQDYGWFVDFVTVTGQNFGGSGGPAIISGRVSYRANDLALSNVELLLTGNSSYTSTSNMSGHYTIEVDSLDVPDDYTLTATKSDDVNGISTYDAARIAQHAAELYVLPELAIIAADVTGNGTITPMDAARVAQYTAEMEVESLCGQWTFVPSERSYEPLLSDMSDQDFTGILYGDVTGNWSPPELEAKSSKSEVSSQSIEVNLITKSNSVKLISNAVDVVAFQFVIESEKEISATLSPTANDWQLIVNQQDEKRWFVGGFGITPLSQEELLSFENLESLEIISGKINETEITIDKINFVAPAVPQSIFLQANYPNPFNPLTTISYQIPTRSKATLTIYSTTGQLVKTLFSGEQDAGEYSLVWDGTDSNNNAVSSGLYFYRLETELTSQIRSMVLLK